MSTVRFTQTELDEYCAIFNAGVMMKWLGFELAFPGAEYVVITLSNIHAAQRGGMGNMETVNGVILAGMFDLALGCTSLLAPPLRRNATIQISMTFERPVRGNSVRCEARVDRAASNVLFSSAQILDETGKICSRASALVSLGVPLTIAEWGSLFAEGKGKTT